MSWLTEFEPLDFGEYFHVLVLFFTFCWCLSIFAPFLSCWVGVFLSIMPRIVIYFIIVVVFGGLFLVNILAGIVWAKFEEEHKLLKQEQKVHDTALALKKRCALAQELWKTSKVSNWHRQCRLTFGDSLFLSPRSLNAH